MNDSTAATPLLCACSLRLSADDKIALVRAFDEAEQARLMYSAAFRAAIAAQETIRKQQECIAELRETLRRIACAAFPVETRE